MRKGRVALALSLPVLATMAWRPASAAPVGVALDLARGAGMTMESAGRYADVFGLSDLTVSPDSVRGVTERFACAFVTVPQTTASPKASPKARTDVGDIGCGTVAVTVDPLLRTASMRGTIKSWIVYFSQKKEGPASRITIDLQWTATGVAMPSAGYNIGHGFVTPAHGYLYFEIGGGLTRNAIASGSVVSATLGAVKSMTKEAGMFEGTDAFAGTAF